ncbi:hypothetical protein EVAR_39030_1 [Eumeta japonica]|uniref:Uncharacterized protein n=1 Tax=Eumeta variegata TaxID=151549 RepID=A0A4C1WN11_EUMVA|nr:hypothetical protein EVAR_39030_1 [Eumeta japonica]
MSQNGSHIRRAIFPKRHRIYVYRNRVADAYGRAAAGAAGQQLSEKNLISSGKTAGDSAARREIKYSPTEILPDRSVLTCRPSAPPPPGPAATADFLPLLGGRKLRS